MEGFEVKRSFFKKVNLILIMILLSMNSEVYAFDSSNIITSSSLQKEAEDNEIKDNEDRVDFAALNLKEKKKSCIKKPECGKGTKIVKTCDELRIIDKKDGWYLVDLQDKLYICGEQQLSIEDENKCFIKDKAILREGKEVYRFKKGALLEVMEDHRGYLKVKTPDGFYGWINRKYTKEEKGIVYVLTEASVYYALDLTPMDNIKNLKAGERVKKVDERQGYCLVESEGKMAWCEKDNLQGSEGEKLSLKKDKKIYEAGIDYVYSAGEIIKVVNASEKDFIKVRTPKGNLAWVNRGDLSYDKDKNMVAAKNTKAYYTGSTEENVVKSGGNILGDTAFREVGYVEEGDNKTKYGDWYGMNAEWCAIFVSWCSFTSGISEDIIPKNSYCKDGADWFVNHKCWFSKNQYTPKKGDITYFYAGEGINHIGIVYEVKEDSLITIEGNMSNSVKAVTHKLSDKDIAGYGAPIFEN